MKEIQLTMGRIATVSDEDYDKLIKTKWRCRISKNNEYAIANTPMLQGRRNILSMHREIMGVTDPNIKIDHRNGNGLCNERWNLRICTTSQNNMNRSNTNNKSGYKGVYARKDKWVDYITVDNKKKYIGKFDTKEMAAIAYNNRATELFGEFAHINVIIGE